jgi:hypothetical protein
MIKRIKARRAYSSLGFSRWGIFTNAFHAADRKTLGCWYFNVHTPWTILEVIGQ